MDYFQNTAFECICLARKLADLFASGAGHQKMLVGPNPTWYLRLEQYSNVTSFPSNHFHAFSLPMKTWVVSAWGSQRVRMKLRLENGRAKAFELLNWSQIKRWRLQFRRVNGALLLNLLVAVIYAKISHLKIAISSRHPRPSNQGQFCASSRGSF